MHEHRRRRLQTLIADHYGGDRKTFCDAAEMSESRLAQLLSSSYRDGQSFGEKAARVLESKLGLADLYFDLLAAGESAVQYASQRLAAADVRIAGSIAISQVSLKLTPGSTRLKSTAVSPTLCDWRFPPEWFEERQLSADKLMAISVTDASMAPVLKVGDVVVVNTADTGILDNAVYLVNCHGEAVIKRMALDFGRWYLTSDNTSRKQYQRQEFDEKKDAVIGRVILMASEQL
ncbi:S24 family peptidase [Herbaspirillum rhizosphaerae]|uniref:S24 family peptidase n=1 Tax=Herbaspirillum rhizosphaerae TaxID=346179 RepID=UPI001F0ADB32|nr:S24 family peptidase [Herbaspirillum rhizosphaerae]